MRAVCMCSNTYPLTCLEALHACQLRRLQAKPGYGREAAFQGICVYRCFVRRPVVKIGDLGLSKQRKSTFISGNMRGG
jgi:hypothetical protein